MKYVVETMRKCVTLTFRKFFHLTVLLMLVLQVVVKVVVTHSGVCREIDVVDSCRLYVHTVVYKTLGWYLRN